MPDKAVPARAGRRWTERHRWVLAAILLLAFVLRAWNLDWDRGTHLHPDERFWSDVAANVENPDSWWDIGLITDPDRSPLNPRVYKPNYVYGTMPLWASEAAAGVLMTRPMQPLVQALDSVGIDLIHDEPVDVPVRNRLRFNTGYDVTIIGRLLSALVDTAIVGVVYLLGFHMAGRRSGLVAAFLQALAVLHIQYSHFLGSEPWVALFVTIVVWGAIKLSRGAGWRTRMVTAVALGLAIGSKLSGVAAIAAPVVAMILVAWPDLRNTLQPRRPRDLDEATGSAPPASSRDWMSLFRTLEPWLVMALVAVAAYRFSQPYDFGGGLSLSFNDRFSQDLSYLNDVNQGGNWPWVQPLVGATPLLHPLRQVFWWGMGPGLALAAVFGVLRAVRGWFEGERFWAIPLSVVAAYLVLVSLQFYAIVRYLQPAYPTLIALAGVGLVAAWRWAATVDEDSAPIATAMRTIVRVAVLVAIASTVFWALAFVNGVYGRDNARLAAGDWMLENIPAEAVVSQQAWDDGIPWGQASPYGRVTLEPFSFGGDSPEGIVRLIAGLDQVDYVIETSNKFYDSLPKTPARFPQITEYYKRLFDGSLGFELVRTFSNPPSLFGITIDDAHAEEAFTVYDHPTVHIWKKTDRYSTEQAYQLLNPDRARVAVNALPGQGSANASMLRPQAYETQQSGSSFSDVHGADPGSFIATVSWFVLMQLAALAVAPIALLRAGRSVGALWGFSKVLGLIGLGLPLWLMVSWGWFELSATAVWAALLVLGLMGMGTAAVSANRLRTVWQEHRNAILAAEAVFVTIFFAVVALRAANPDLWHPWRGGEKPMELAYFTAVSGSTTLPPYDPWLAGGSLNYYYMGWFLLSVPTRILGIPPDIAFNLGVATYAGLAAVTLYSTASLFADVANRSRIGSRISRTATGLLATVMFLVVGNLDPLRQVIMRIREGLPLSEFDWWDPSRVNKQSAGLEVTEFPAFTVLFADLHPHFMAMTIFGLGLGGCLAYVELTRRGDRTMSWVLAVGLGVATALVRMIHTWDFPTIVMAVGGSVVVAAMVAPGPSRWRVKTALAHLGAIGVLHLIVTAPYRRSNQVAASGFHRSESSTNLDDWLFHWGLFLFVGATYLVLRLVHLHNRDRTSQPSENSETGETREPRETGGLSGARIGAAVGVVGFALLHLMIGSVAAWALVGAATATLLLWNEATAARAETAWTMTAALWALGFAVMVAVEIFTQDADIARLNTVFKFWLQVWHLFAVAAAASAMWILAKLAPKAESASNWPRRLFGTGLTMLVAIGLIFPVLAHRPRSANRFDTALGPSLRGHLWLEPGAASLGIKDAFEREYTIEPGLDRPIIDWLQANAQGRPTILEAVGGAEYQWWGRISITTGLPTVLGWRWHQVQQRTLFDAKVNERKDDVARFFVATTYDAVERTLRAYDVTYVIVGSIESVIADPTTLRILAEHPALKTVFRQGRTAIYEVDQSRLRQSSGAIESAESG